MKKRVTRSPMRMNLSDAEYQMIVIAIEIGHRNKIYQ